MREKSIASSCEHVEFLVPLEHVSKETGNHLMIWVKNSKQRSGNKFRNGQFKDLLSRERKIASRRGWTFREKRKGSRAEPGGYAWRRGIPKGSLDALARKRGGNWRRYNGSQEPACVNCDPVSSSRESPCNGCNALRGTPAGHSGVSQLWEPQKEEVLSKKEKPSRKEKHQEQRHASKFSVW